MLGQKKAEARKQQANNKNGYWQYSPACIDTFCCKSTGNTKHNADSTAIERDDDSPGSVGDFLRAFLVFGYSSHD